MGASQRTKGHNFEREVANLLKPIFPDAKRGFQTRGGTAEAPDVDGTPFWIECKRGKKTNPLAALEQAESAGQRIPVAICKDDYKDATVTMRATDFVWLATEKADLSHFDVDACDGLPVAMSLAGFLALLEELYA